MSNVLKSTLISAVIMAGLAACSDDEKTTISTYQVEDTTRDFDLSDGEYACYVFNTNSGNFTIALDEAHAPIAAENFETYVDQGFYDNILFHNVIKDFVAQSGIYDVNLQAQTANSAIKSEASNGLLNYRGRIAMSLSSANSLDSATSGFFINVQDNHHLDGLYTVFGGVVEGMEVVDQISEARVSSREGFSFLPNQSAVINSVTAQSCPSAAEAIVDKEVTYRYPVLEDDASAAIDVSRGDYACYTMVTSLGNVELAVDELYAPSTAANFKTYVDDSFYDGVIFHRVIDDFMVQTGGFTSGLEAKDTLTPVESESSNGLKNYTGRIAMARTSSPHSATSQFFINLEDNDFLDKENASDSWGYTVFGGVISGMDVINQIGQVNTHVVSGRADVPVNEITVDSITPSSCPAP